MYHRLRDTYSPTSYLTGGNETETGIVKATKRRTVKRAPSDKRLSASSDPADTAAHHKKTRLARSREITQDYVEAIGDQIATTGEARVVDIARRLGVSHVTVNRTVARLQRDGLVTTAKYRAVFLTEAGRAMAERVKYRHEVVVAFLQRLGVGTQDALSDAEGIEHHVSDGTLTAFEKFLGWPRSKR